MEFFNTVKNLSFIAGIFIIIFMILTTTISFIDIMIKPPNLKQNPRHKANLRILAQLLKYVDENPDQRFGQILRNTGVVVDIGVRDSAQEEWETPDYYWDRGVHEESIATLTRMELNKRGIYNEVKIITNRKEKKELS